MAWSWRYLNDDRAEIVPQPAPDLPEQTFTSQSDAESWLGEHWRELLSSGVTDVKLLEADTARYEMSLVAAAETEN